MSESTEAVLVAEIDPDREEAWLQKMSDIHIALFGCLDDGPTPEPPKPPPGATDLERLCYPPGLLGHATDHAYRCTDLPDRQLALWGAKAGLGKIVDRKLITPRGGATTAYDLLLAATGAGKERAMQFSLLLLRSAELALRKCSRVACSHQYRRLWVRFGWAGGLECWKPTKTSR